VLAGVAAAKAGGSARTGHAEAILEEMAAVRAGLAKAKAGDLVVMCVDDAVAVYREAMAASGTSARGGSAFADPGELEAPDG
jgi:cyanophycin synthetase